MANTYTQVHVQFVIAVKFREALIAPAWEKQLYSYISGIIRNHGHKPLAVNGMPDHVHVFAGIHPSESMSTLMQTVKGESSEWINKQGFTRHYFRWQEGYGAFSYARSQVPAVFSYVLRQKEHHQTKSFLDEYKKLLVLFEIEYDPKYIFCEPK
jgi:putative transposase